MEEQHSTHDMNETGCTERARGVLGTLEWSPARGHDAMAGLTMIERLWIERVLLKKGGSNS